MGDPEFAPKVPIASHLTEFQVPKEIVEDIIKCGWTCALVWGSALKEEQLANLFLRTGTTYGPASEGNEGGPEDLPATCVGPVPWYSVRVWPLPQHTHPGRYARAFLSADTLSAQELSVGRPSSRLVSSLRSAHWRAGIPEGSLWSTLGGLLSGPYQP